MCQIQSGDGSCFEFSGNISMQGVNKEQNASGWRPPALSAPRYWNHQIIKTTIGHGEPQGGDHRRCLLRLCFHCTYLSTSAQM